MFWLFDLSGSTANRPTRRAYYAGVKEMVDHFVGGETVMASRITANSLASGSLPIRISIPAPGADENEMDHAQKLTMARTAILAKVQKLLLGENSPLDDGSKTYPLPVSAHDHTDIMNSLQIADKVFNGDTKNVASKRLIVFSDMVEQTGRYDFSSQWHKSRIQEIIQAEQQSGRMPNLKSVRVWVAGATASASDGLPPATIYAIQNFWLQYFKQAGADLDKSRYAPMLLNWES